MPGIGITRTRSQETYDLLRERIRLTAPGVPLPSVSELMAEFSVSKATLASAYAELERSGLVERKPRKGVVVADRAATGELAIVMTQDGMGAEASPSYRMAVSALREALHDLNPDWAVKLHLGISTVPGPEFPATLDLLHRDVLPRLRGVFSFYPLYELDATLEQANVPVVHLADFPTRKYCVRPDVRGFLRQSVEHLAQAGCRSIGFLWSKYVGAGPGEASKACLENLQFVADETRRHGLIFMDKWIAHEEGGYGEQTGYDLFTQLWQGPQRPDAVIVSDYLLCKGALRAALHLGVRLPEDVRLIALSIRGVPLPYHEPVTCVEFDPETQAKRAAGMMATLVRGEEPPEPVVTLPGELVRGNTT